MERNPVSSMTNFDGRHLTQGVDNGGKLPHAPQIEERRLMPDKRSLIGLRQRASELADTGRLNSWHEIGVALEAEGYPLALLRMDLDTCLRQTLRARFGQTRVTTGVRHAL